MMMTGWRRCRLAAGVPDCVIGRLAAARAEVESCGSRRRLTAGVRICQPDQQARHQDNQGSEASREGPALPGPRAERSSRGLAGRRAGAPTPWIGQVRRVRRLAIELRQVGEGSRAREGSRTGESRRTGGGRRTSGGRRTVAGSSTGAGRRTGAGSSTGAGRHAGVGRQVQESPRTSGARRLRFARCRLRTRPCARGAERGAAGRRRRDRRNRVGGGSGIPAQAVWITEAVRIPEVVWATNGDRVTKAGRVTEAVWVTGAVWVTEAVWVPEAGRVTEAVWVT